MNNNFNIFQQVKEELDDFFTEKVKIGSAVVDGITKGGFDYSQWETIQNIEFVDNSKFINGEKDKEGQTKFYLNTASFRKEVASKNIDIDVKNFNFVPEEGQPEYGAIIARKKFKRWAKDNGLSDKINDTVDRFPKYGTIVAKKVGKEIEIVPLAKLRNQQDATSLEDASYVIEEHTDLNIHELMEYKGWDLSDLKLKWNDKTTVYERYGFVPASFYKSKGYKSDKEDDEAVYCLSVVTLEKSKDGKTGGALLFMEETECPYIERHYARQDGRWLGIGEIEKQIDNQAARNMVFNLRKKGLAWASKNVFGSSDDTLVNNLSMQVRDGDVLKLSNPNAMWRIDTANRAGADYNAVDTLLEENSNQRSFTFEVATGESMASGTPFRLGALLGNSVNSYYDKKRETLGLFWKSVVVEIMIPSWVRETEEEFIEGVLDTEEGFEELREAKKARLFTDMFIESVIMGKEFDPEQAKLIIEEGLARTVRDNYKMTKDEIKNLKYRIDLDITGESIDMPKKIETLSNMSQFLMNMGDAEGARAILKRIAILTGEKMPRTAPQIPQPMQPQAPQAQPEETTMPSANPMSMPTTTL